MNAVREAVRKFFALESASGLVLVGAAVAAMLIANSPLVWLYDALVDLPVEVRVGELQIEKALLLWINDGLMAIFFFLVGLELKREFIEGELSDPSRIALPALGALGGMAVPSLIYAAINRGDPVALEGWAIPAATDIAFALAILGLLGNRVPAALRVFLVSVAIFDDVGAIVIIALFYTSQLSLTALAVAAVCLPLLYAMNRYGVLEKAPYLLIGIVLWTSLLKSGVHATLSGVVLALFIPIRDSGAEHDPFCRESKSGDELSPLHSLEHDLAGAVYFIILPLFAFVNAGVTLPGFSSSYLLHPVSLGIAAGLFIGKPIGVFLFCWLGGRIGLATLPSGLNWPQIFGAGALCGVGFTMSLFIGGLAFESTGVNQLFDERIGIIAGSVLSGIAGYLLLRKLLPSKP